MATKLFNSFKNSFFFIKETENLSKIIYFLHCIFSSISFSTGGIKRARNYQLLFLPYILYSNIFQLYIELTVFDNVL